MLFHCLDIMSVSCVVAIAVGFLYYNYKKIKTGTCATLCSGCSGSSCSSKSFASDKKVIILKVITN